MRPRLSVETTFCVAIIFVQVFKIDTEHNLVYVKGHVPGNKGSYLRLTDAINGAKFPSPPPLPTFVPEVSMHLF